MGYGGQVQIWKRISFSLDGSLGWVVSLKYRRGINAGFLIPFFDFPGFQVWNAVSI
jgi:hypothetical protein